MVLAKVPLEQPPDLENKLVTLMCSYIIYTQLVRSQRDSSLTSRNTLLQLSHYKVGDCRRARKVEPWCRVLAMDNDHAETGQGATEWISSWVGVRHCFPFGWFSWVVDEVRVCWSGAA